MTVRKIIQRKFQIHKKNIDHTNRKLDKIYTFYITYNENLTKKTDLKKYILSIEFCVRSELRNVSNVSNRKGFRNVQKVRL